MAKGSMQWSDRVGRRIKLRDLHIVLAVAQAGTMAKAAAQLSVSHPVISKTISELERTLGVRLFDRTTHGVEPTSHGKALLDCGAAVFDEMRSGLKHIEYLTNATTGELRMGCPEAMSAGLMPLIVERFLEKHRGIQLHVAFADTAQARFHELRSRNLELVVGPIPEPFQQDDLKTEILLREPFFVVASLDSPWARRRKIQLSDMRGERWIFPPSDSIPGRLIGEIFATSKLALPRASIVNLSIHLTTQMLAAGGFVALLPGYVARFSVKQLPLKMLPVQLPDRRVSVGIVTVKSRTSSPLAKLFIDHAREIAGSVTSWGSS
jgi:DNA-binding transcriptional LysR family regulator